MSPLALRRSDFESVRFICTSMLNFIPPKTIKLFLNQCKKFYCFYALNKTIYTMHADYVLYFRLSNYITKYGLHR